MTRARAVAAAFIAMVVLALAVTQAWAHARLLSSSPAAGDVLADPPERIQLVFSERVQHALTTVTLVGPGADSIPLSPSRAGASDREVLLDVLAVPAPGEYAVVWRTVSADGHPVSGRIPFVVTAPEPVPGDPAPAVTVPEVPATPDEDAGPAGFHVLSPSFVVLRWVSYTALLGVLGAVVFLVVILPGVASADGAWRGLAREAGWRARRFGSLAAVLFLLVSIARLVAQGAALAGPVDVDMTVINAIAFESLWGRSWILQVIAAMIILLVLPAAERPWARFTGAGAALVLAASVGSAGHALTAPIPVLAVFAHTLHVLGVGAWLGTLGILLLAGLPTARRSGAGAARMASLVNVFSPIALFCGVMVVISGVLAAALHLGGISVLWETNYGRTLMLKVAVVAVVLGIGGYHWRRVRSGLPASGGDAPLRASGSAELAFSIIVLLVTAVLVATPPPD